jgi:hypothetical protein
MIWKMDEDLKRVTEFMQNNLPADKLVGVAVAISDLAPSLWGHYGRDRIIPMELRHPELARV